jgi:hypothetical protein
MTDSHPKGPRVFRSFFEADRQFARSKVNVDRTSPEGRSLLTTSLVSAIGLTNKAENSPFTVQESTAMPQSIPIHQSVSLNHPQGIDLTEFAGRVVPPSTVLGSGFELPASFSTRLSATRPTVIPAAHPVDLSVIHLPAMAAKS